jgi:hypothetical protein
VKAVKSLNLLATAAAKIPRIRDVIYCENSEGHESMLNVRSDGLAMHA